MKETTEERFNTIFAQLATKSTWVEIKKSAHYDWVLGELLFLLA
jgi:hypothetical protein